MKSVVLALLPNAGLGNKLFVWAKAQVFAQLNGLDSMAIGWTYPKIGPLLRGERSLRMYGGHFRGPRMATAAKVALRYASGRKHWEPQCAELSALAPDVLYVFKSMPHWRDYFTDIREHRDLIVSRLGAALRPSVVTALDRLQAPLVALHVRRGDFRTLRDGERFDQVGGVRTPDDYFVQQTKMIRQAAGWDVPVTIFSDASTPELAALLSLPAISRSKAPNDILDLLLMSRASIIVCSAGSTFSEWSGFLSDALVIRHPRHVHGAIRPTARFRHLERPAPESPAAWAELWNAVAEPLNSKSWCARA